MRIWTKLLALVLVFGIAVSADAKEKKKGDKSAGVRGTITSVEADSIKIETGTKKVPGEAKTYKTKDAVISINGELKTAGDLKVGMMVSVKATGDNATAVTAMGKGKGAKKKKAA